MSEMANNVDNCPYCESVTADVLEYDSDEDMYLLKCSNGHSYWEINEDGVWK